MNWWLSLLKISGMLVCVGSLLFMCMLVRWFGRFVVIRLFCFIEVVDEFCFFFGGE